MLPHTAKGILVAGAWHECTQGPTAMRGRSSVARTTRDNQLGHIWLRSPLTRGEPRAVSSWLAISHLVDWRNHN